MLKTGVITDGISRDLDHALEVMDEFGLEYAELQYVGEKQAGEHSKEEIAKIKDSIERHGKKVSSVSGHIFAGLTSANKPRDPDHVRHMENLKRVIEMAQELGAPFVRTMSNKKEQILWGRNGAEVWNVAKGAWESVAPLMAPAVELAKAEGIKLATETGNGLMINSCYTARKLIDEMDAKDTLKVLWDPANNCWCHELAYPDGYDLIRDGYIGHIHMKDVQVDTPKATLEVRRMGTGQLADLFAPIAAALREDGYDGVISFESVYHPGNGNFEDGFRECIGEFQKHFC